MRTISLAALLVIVAFAQAEAPNLKQVEERFGGPVLLVAKPAAAPTIDGKLDDACWADAKPVTLGFSTGAWWNTPSQKTEARVLADDKAIYFAVKCLESEADRIIKTGQARKGMVVGCDAVEFFLDPGCKGKRHEYYHVIVTPDEKVYTGRGREPEGWKGTVNAKVGKTEGGWTVEAAIPLAELGIKDGAIPKVWGLNVCRQRPELAADMPKAARDAGAKRMDPPMWKVDAPEKYRLAEYTCWSPTMAEFCGWPFYADSRPFHTAQRFGRAALEVGTQDATPPAKRFEVIYKSDFDDGQVGAFKNGAVVDDSFRGPGKCLTFAEKQGRMQFTQPLEDIDDVTIIFALRVNEAPKGIPHLNISGKAPDGISCGAERYEFFLTPEEAAPRTRYLEDYHKEKYGDGPFRLYDTHADMIRWKPCGRVYGGPGPWAMVEGFFAEPSANQVRWPGKDWVIVRIRPALFRRAPQPKMGQRLVDLAQNYPEGLSIGANPTDGVRIDDFIVFRGTDTEPPEKVKGVKFEAKGDELELTWEKAKDNTITAFYRIYADKKLVAESHRLSAKLKKADVGDAPLTIVAVDLYGNASEPSQPVTAPK